MRLRARNGNGLSVGAGGIRTAHVAQLVEHVLGKDEVSGSIPLVGSRFRIWETDGAGDGAENLKKKHRRPLHGQR